MILAIACCSCTLRVQRAARPRLPEEEEEGVELEDGPPPPPSLEGLPRLEVGALGRVVGGVVGVGGGPGSAVRDGLGLGDVGPLRAARKVMVPMMSRSRSMALTSGSARKSPTRQLLGVTSGSEIDPLAEWQMLPSAV